MKKLIALVAALVALTVPAVAVASHDVVPRGAIYALTNSVTGNGVAYFSRAANGGLTLVATYQTGGLGTGAGLGSQGSITLDDNLLFAVNAGSDSISEFAVENDGLRLVRVFASNGVRPISATAHGNLLYVLNAGSSSITGFRVAGRGRVTPLEGSTQTLLGSGPAQIGFSGDGRTLVVTEKTSSTLDTFTIDPSGRARAGVSSPSAGATPFGFAFDGRDRAFVSEAAGSASSYAVDAAGAHVISGAVATGQAAPCWLVATPNGRYAYTANAGGGSISGFTIDRDGGLALASTTTLGTGSHPLDESVSADGRFLYVLVDGRHTVAAFQIAADGTLTRVGEAGALPAGAIGLAAS
jgi:6-phosphogluconolactonase (cycloisomerase 2 family)